MMLAGGLVKRLRSIGQAGREIFSSFFAHRPFMLAASLSYYTLLSLAPLVVVLVAVASVAYGPRAARGELVAQIQDHVGQSAATMIQSLLAQAHARGQGFSLAVGSAAAVLGATTVFVQLQTSLNMIWGVKAQSRGWMAKAWLLVRDRLLSLVVMVALGLVLLAMLVVDIALAAAQHYLPAYVAGQWWLWRAIDLGASLVIVMAVVAVLFKTLPDVRIGWRGVWLGSAVTAVLFTLGRWVIAIYLAHAAVVSAYGAAGSIVALLIWVYYSALILFFGAEMTRVLAERSGVGIEPAKHAVWRQER